MQIEGIPDGWELVRIGEAKLGDWFLNSMSIPNECGCRGIYGGNLPIIRKIEKQKRYRPFANAEEFKPHRNKWWRYKDGDSLFRAPCSYDNSRYYNTTWQDCFYEMIFDDGTPFGVEVAE